MVDTLEDGGDMGDIRVGMRTPGMTPAEEAQEAAALTDEQEQERIRELIQQTLEEKEAEHPTPKTPEEAEHQALEDVFADIRHESHYGRLVTREHWEAEGFVPEHLDADEFAQLVFDTLAGVPEDADEPEDADLEDAVETPEGQELQEEPIEAPEAPEDQDGGAGEGTDAAEEEDTAPSDEPDEQEKPQLAPLVFDDIVVMEGTKAKYLYSNEEMTDAFAKWSFLAAEDDKVATFVSTVREESEVYPRPMKEVSLTHDPFDMTIEEIRNTWDIVRESGDYPDIETCTASNGDNYYYSTKFLEDAQAEALAEYYSVRRFMSP